jgi:hypothetical protein
MARLSGHERPASAGATTDAVIEQYIRNHADIVYRQVGSCGMGQDADVEVDTRLRSRHAARHRLIGGSSGRPGATGYCRAAAGAQVTGCRRRAAAPAQRRPQGDCLAFEPLNHRGIAHRRQRVDLVQPKSQLVGSGATASSTHVYKDLWFRDHAPLTVGYDLQL